jgi:hypothetical protein
LLSREESKEILDNLDMPAFVAPGKRAPTLAEAFETATGHTREEIKVCTLSVLFDSLVCTDLSPAVIPLQNLIEGMTDVGTQPHNADMIKLLHSTGQPILQMIRVTMAPFTASRLLNLVARQGNPDALILAANVWQKTTTNWHLLTHNLHRPLSEPFASGLKHRFLTHDVLAHRVAQSKGLPERRERETLQKHGMYEVQRFMREDLEDKDIDLLEPILRALAIMWVPKHDRDLPPGQPSPTANPGWYGMK